MKLRRITSVIGGCCVFLLMIFLVATESSCQQAAPLDVQKTLQEILRTLKSQQAQIDELRAAIQRQAETIQAQQRLIERQQQDLASQQKKIQQAAAGGGLDAAVQYRVAMELQHIAIFDVRRREQPAYFRRCIEEFRKIVNEWPSSPHAPEAQYRIAKIYHRYLRESANAIREYELLLRNYPDSEYIPEARDALKDLRGQ